MYRFYVTGNQQLTDSTLLLTLKKNPTEKPFSFQPGQYASISFKNNGRPTPARNFSIINSPTDQGTLQFSIRVKGRFTNALTTLAEGDEVNVRGPFGNFVFDQERDKDTVMIAGGIGIAPFIGMIRFATATNLSNKIKLIYSFRDQNDAPFVGQIMNFDNLNPNFKSIFVVGEGPTDKFAGHDVLSGRMSSDIIDQVTDGDFENKTFSICGSPKFMADVTQILKDKGIDESKIMTEAFGQSSHRRSGKLFAWPPSAYVMGAVGLATASIAIMISDFTSALAAQTAAANAISNTGNQAGPTNSRQDQLDGLVNGLPSAKNNSPASSAAAQTAAGQAQTSTSTSTPASVTTGSTSAPAASSPAPVYVAPAPTPPPASTPAPKPAPAPTPAPKPVPVCTTTQSGVITCV